MNGTRIYTKALFSAIEEGMLDTEEVLKLLAGWLTESEVQSFVEDHDWEELLGLEEEGEGEEK